MLGGKPAGVSLTESLAMRPASAASGFYFGHRDSRYFGVARIGRDQLEDYAARRGIAVEDAERGLRPNLDYSRRHCTAIWGGITLTVPPIPTLLDLHYVILAVSFSYVSLGQAIVEWGYGRD
jgi:hypothetical protein